MIYMSSVFLGEETDETKMLVKMFTQLDLFEHGLPTWRTIL